MWKEIRSRRRPRIQSYYQRWKASSCSMVFTCTAANSCRVIFFQSLDLIRFHPQWQSESWWGRSSNSTTNDCRRLVPSTETLSTMRSACGSAGSWLSSSRRRWSSFVLMKATSSLTVFHQGSGSSTMEVLIRFQLSLSKHQKAWSQGEMWTCSTEQMMRSTMASTWSRLAMLSNHLLGNLRICKGIRTYLSNSQTRLRCWQLKLTKKWRA